MLKLSIVAAALAAAGATAVIVHHPSSPNGVPTRAAIAMPATRPLLAAPPPPSPPPHRAVAPPRAPTLADSEDAPALVVPAPTLERLAITQGPARGPANAPVTIVVFQDNMCPFCGQVLGTIDQLWDEYPNKLRLVVKQFPVHEAAKLAAEASYAADEQGKFWELHDLMFANQDDLTRDDLLRYAQRAGMDVAKLTRALDEHTYQAALTRDFEAAREIGVTATPQFLINGTSFTGARPIEELRAAIEAALAAS